MPDYRTVTAPGGDDIHLGAIEFWRRPLDERHDAFAALRAESRNDGGMCFHEELSVIEGGVKGPGFWSAVTYEDVRAINRNPFVFSSASGITLGEQPPETLEFFGSMIVMDDPRHAKFRLLVQKGFTPKTVAGVETSVRARAQALVEQAKQTGGACDFVEQFAAPLPLQVICDMLGVPAEDEAQILEWTNHILGAGDPDFTLDLDGLILAAAGMFEYAQALGQDRLESPRDDITSILMHAEVDGQRLTPAEFGSFFILLAVAGNETTRNAISWGMHQLTKHPDQHELLPRQLRRAGAARRRRDRALVVASDPHAAQGQRGHPHRQHRDRRWREGRDVVLVGEPRRNSVRRPGPLRHHAPERRSERCSDGGLRRRRAALLPRRQPRPT